MFRASSQPRACVLVIAALLALPDPLAIAQQQGPVAALFADDEKRGRTIAASFSTADLPATSTAAAPARVYLTGGDLERAFDMPRIRAEGAIVPTNAELSIAAPSPATQRVLMDRVAKHPDVMRDLQAQITARLEPPTRAPGAAASPLSVGVDSLLAYLPRGSKQAGGPFPRVVCLIATDFAKGGAIDRRELFDQDRVRKGIAGCLAALDGAGVQSVVMPLMGAASSGTQAKDLAFAGQRILKECRLLNSVAGMALGVHDFSRSRRNIREIGIIQWDQELAEMFAMPKGAARSFAQDAYQLYADQIKLALRKGLAGERTTASDIDSSCSAIFNAQ
jgi:hypothetical protein